MPGTILIGATWVVLILRLTTLFHSGGSIVELATAIPLDGKQGRRRY